MSGRRRPFGNGDGAARAEWPTTSAIVSGRLFDQRLNQTDLRLTKTFRYSRGRIHGMLDVYNAFNNRAPQTINPTYGAAWLTPTTLLEARLLKFGAQIDF